MKLRSTAPMKTAKAGYIVLSFATIVAGILFTAFPGASSRILAGTLGMISVLFGIIKLVGYWSKDLYRLAFQFDLEFGILLIAAGSVMIFHPGMTLNIISVSVGVVTLFDGLFKSRIAFESKRFGISGWWSIMALGLIADLAGFALILRPSESIGVITVLTGVSMIADGALNLAVALGTVKVVKTQYPDIIDPDYSETEDALR